MNEDGDSSHNKVAVALRYDHGKTAVPTVVATGRGLLADKIVAAAERADVPVERDRLLAHALSKVEIEKAIPPELYKAVATVIGFLMRRRRL